MKQFTQKINRLRIPVDGKQTGWLWTSEAKELNQGLPGTNPATGQRDLNSRLSVCKM